ncbi:MAG TPA: type II secretion system minor pseudopilin GspI [Steroidobacteraceae bacterium]|nr:type II secretion system minor pseudopilin GspI [Steroidobacteraceae bacterium]
MRSAAARRRPRGFTLIEVLVALVIVAFGMGAVLAALNASAANISALREKTLAQWVALNRVSDVRLNLQPPQTGTTEGDVKGFGNGDWHWQQIVTAVQEIPGLMQITVKVRRNPPGTLTGSTASSSSSSKLPDWVTTVIGFRGDALAAASGETPDWTGPSIASSSSSGGATPGNVANPGTATAPGISSTPSTSSTPTNSTSRGSSSSGGP